MAEQRKNESTRETGADVANVGTGRERAIVGRSERRIDAANRPTDEMKHEVAQRGVRTDAHDNRTGSSEPSAPPPLLSSTEDQTSGYGNREDRENPGAGLGAQQSGERQSHDLHGEGTRVGKDELRRAKGEAAGRESRASSQNAARISDFEDRPSR